jgi:hypothetical protein
MIRGLITYAGSGLPVGGVDVDLVGAQAANTQTDGLGAYEFAGLTPGTWSVIPRRTGGLAASITSTDVQTALEASVGTQTLDAEQELACDVTADGSVSAYDGALMLQRIDATLLIFPVVEQCDSDWIFFPVPTPAPGGSAMQPAPAPDTCEPGSITFAPLTQSAEGQNFSAAVFGDCDLDWMP